MVRRSAPPSSMCVAKECRSVCGEIPPWSAVRRAWRPSRRRTSEVERRRPLFEMNSARSRSRGVGERRAAACQVALERLPGVLAHRHHAGLSALPLHPHLLGVGIDRPGVQVHDLLGAEAGRVGQLEQRPVAEVERARGGHALEQVGHLAGAQHARQVGVAPGRGHQVARVGLERAPLHQMPVEGPERGQLAPHRGLRRAALGQHAREAPQVPVAHVGRRQTLGGGPLRELRQVHSVGTAGLLPHAACALPVVEPAQGLGPTSLLGRGTVLRQHSGRTGGHAALSSPRPG